MEQKSWIEVGTRIQEERTRLGYTQELLAEKLEVSVDHIRNVEKGRRGVSVKMLIKLNELTGISTDYFLTGKTACEGNYRLQELVSGMDPALCPYAEQMLTVLINATNQK